MFDFYTKYDQQFEFYLYKRVNDARNDQSSSSTE